MEEDRKARSKSRPGQRSKRGLGLVFIGRKEALEVWCRGRGTRFDRGLREKVEPILLIVPRGPFEEALTRLGRPLALVAAPVETPDRKDPEYDSSDLAGALGLFVTIRGELPEEGRVCGSVWLAGAPAERDACAWLERLPERYINALMRDREGRGEQERGRGRRKQPAADEGESAADFATATAGGVSRRGPRAPTEAERAVAEKKLELLRDFKARLLATIGPFRTEFKNEILPAMQGQGFYERNAEAADELIAILALLGTHLCDPDHPDRIAYLAQKAVPGTLGGNLVVRSQQSGGRKRKILSARTTLPERLLAAED